MTEFLIGRVKNSLNKQFYIMNDSWLTDCVEYYLNDHENPTQEEIMTFVMNQWVLSDLREINNENGCLPKDLAQKKCTTLPGKYILQMDKIYDISISKYKQLEKIRNVSSENVEATENENTAQEDKFQAWEPKSKRMLQLFLTDGAQDVLAIEYKPIRFLKDNLYPGFKLLIKGPVICRKGVILLEETNITEIGGEVESLLIVNAVENVFARALNLEENPDPYNDNNKQPQSTQSTQISVQIEDDFDIDTQKIEQIEKQAQQQNFNSSKSSTVSITRNEQKQISTTSNNLNNRQTQSIKNQQLNSGNNLNINKNTTQKQNYGHNDQKTMNSFEDDDDSFLQMVDEKVFESLPMSKPNTILQHKSSSNKLISSSGMNQNQNEEFPMDNEIYDLAEEQSSFFTTSKSRDEQPKLTSNFPNKPSSSKSNNLLIGVENNICRSEISEQQRSALKSDSKDIFRNEFNNKSSSSNVSSSKFMANKIPLVSNISEFPDDDFDFDEFDIKKDDFEYNHNKNDKSKASGMKFSQGSSGSSSKLINSSAKVESSLKQFSNVKNDKTEASNIKLSQASLDGSSKLKNNSVKVKSSSNQFSSNKISIDSSSETKYDEYNSVENFGSEFEDEFDFEYVTTRNADHKISSSVHTMNKNEKPKAFKPDDTTSIKSGKQIDKDSPEITGVKRPASTISPEVDAPQKVRCLESTPKVNKTSNRKITDFLSKQTLLPDDTPKLCEFICNILKKPLKDEEIRTVVRGKVVNIIKLNLLKGENGSYFHLEGTVTDGTANLDIVFSSEVLEKIIGYSPQELSKKRKQSKANPAIKDQLREDLKQAQKILRIMDALMEIVLKKNEKALIVNIMELSEKQKNALDKRIKLLKK